MGTTLGGAAKKKKENVKSEGAKSDAREIIAGDVWRTSDPDASPTRENNKYKHTFLLRLNDWEAGALASAAKGDERSLQQVARRVLREHLKQTI